MNLLLLLQCRSDEECNYGKCVLGHCECNSQYYQLPNCSQCISMFMLPDQNCSCQSSLLAYEQLCEQCIDSIFLDPFTLCTSCKGRNFNFDDRCNSCVDHFDFATGCANCIAGYSLYKGQCIDNTQLRGLLVVGMFAPLLLAFAFGTYLTYRKLLHKGKHM